jgi:hypothetical protein
MGTSKAYPLPTSGNWPGVKADVTSWASSGGAGNTSVAAVFSSYVAAMGGAQQAASGMQTAARAGARLGGFFAGVAANGLSRTLEDAGLGDLVGRPARDVMQGLVQFIIGADISLIEDNVVIDAYMDYRDEMSELVGSFEEFAAWLAAQLDRAGVDGLVQRFFGHCIYRQFLRDHAERINRAAGSVRAANRLYRQAREYIFDKIEALLRDRSSAPMRWTRDSANKLASSILTSLMRILGVSDGSAR